MLLLPVRNRSLDARCLRGGDVVDDPRVLLQVVRDVLDRLGVAVERVDALDGPVGSTQSSWICFQQVVFADADCALAVGDCAAP